MISYMCYILSTKCEMKEEYKDFIKILTLLKTVKRGIDLTDVAVFPVHFLEARETRIKTISIE